MSQAIANALRIAQSRTERNPSDAQKESGNYAKGKLSYKGMTIAIENPKGSERSGVDKGGKRWSVKMPASYGYVLGTESKDGDHVDVYLGPKHDSDKVFVVDQVNADNGRFDEHKVMLSYPDKSAALSDYEKAFSDGKAKDRIGAVTEMSVGKFRDWLKSGNTKKPVGELRMKRAHGGPVMGYADGGSLDELLGGYDDTPARMPEREMRRIMQARLAGVDLPGADQRLAGHEAWQREVGEPGAINAVGELSGINSMGRGATNVGRGLSEGDWKKALAGVGEFGIGALPFGAAALPARSVIPTLAAFSASSLPYQVHEANANTAQKVADYIAKDPAVARLREELSAVRSLKPGIGPGVDALETRLGEAEKDFAAASAKNYKSAEARRLALAPLTDKQKALRDEIRAERQRSSEASGSERAARIQAIERQIAEAESAASAEFMKNAPFRDRHPGVSQQIVAGAGALAGLMPFAAGLKTNLMDRYIHQPAILRQSQRAEQALTGGTAQPGIIERMLGKKPETVVADAASFNRERDVLDRMLSARDARSPSPLKDVALGAGYMMEGRMLPEEIDAISFGPGHPTRDAALKELSSPDFYVSGIVPSLMAGITSAGTRKLADVASKSEMPALSRAEAVRDWDWATKGPKAAVRDGASPDAMDAIVGRGSRTPQQSPDTAAFRDALSLAKDRHLTGDQRGVSGRSSEASPRDPSPSSEVSPSPSAVSVSSDLSNMPLPPGVKLNARGLPYNAHTGHPLRKQLYTAREEATSKPNKKSTPENKGNADPKPKGETAEEYMSDPDKLTRGMRTGGLVDRALSVARKYVSGGSVLVGPVVGATGGREDALPVDVPHGSFVVPADVVSHLGTGNSLAGMERLKEKFGEAAPRSRADGGAVPIRISDGEFVVSPEQVAKIGGGDMERGHKVLDQLIIKLRADHIKTLKSLPGPAKS